MQLELNNYATVREKVIAVLLMAQRHYGRFENDKFIYRSKVKRRAVSSVLSRYREQNPGI